MVTPCAGLIAIPILALKLTGERRTSNVDRERGFDPQIQEFPDPAKDRESGGT